MKVFDTLATRQALAFDRLIPALAEMFRVGCEQPARHVHQVPAPDGPALTLLLMPAWRTGGHLGVKTVLIAPGNGARGLPGLHGSYTLYDARSGVPLAQMDADELTARRTAATSALAASFLAPREAGHLLVLGSGRVARLLPLAYRSAVSVGRVSVWSRQRGHADALVQALVEQGFDAVTVSDLGPAVRAADWVSSATLATEPLVRGEWLRPGSHLDLIGSFTPAAREADDACLRGAALYVDNEEALHKSGDLLGPLASGAISAGDLRGTLADLCRGQAPIRSPRTVFKSVGAALEDLAAASLVYDSQP